MVLSTKKCHGPKLIGPLNVNDFKNNGYFCDGQTSKYEKKLEYLLFLKKERKKERTKPHSIVDIFKKIQAINI